LEKRGFVGFMAYFKNRNLLATSKPESWHSEQAISLNLWEKSFAV